MIWFLAIFCVSALLGSDTRGLIPHHADSTSPLLTEQKLYKLNAWLIQDLSVKYNLCFLAAFNIKFIQDS